MLRNGLILTNEDTFKHYNLTFFQYNIRDNEIFK
jgi:hypothetical protein